jgi:hypothetical protein
VREQGEALIREIENVTSIEQAKAAAAKLKALGRAFVHERLSTKAIIE